MTKSNSSWKYCRSDKSMPFLDTLVTPRSDGSFSTTVYRKPTQTDLYLQWDSHHSIAAKYSVVNTLHHRARAVCSNPAATKRRWRSSTGGPNWKQVPHMGTKQGEKWRSRHPKDKIRTNGTTSMPMVHQCNKKPYMVLPYLQGLSESLKDVCRKHGVQVHHKGGNTIKSILMAPKDKDPITKKSGII